MNIVLVGTGNVAFVLSRLLMAAGHSIKEVCGRNSILLHRISLMTGAEINVNPAEITDEADVCIIAVADTAIAEVTKQMKPVNMLVVHTSGATSKETLSRFASYGVLYPLQSLRKEMERLPPIPFFIDANTKNNVDQLFALVSSTGNQVTLANDEERLKLHIAAVLCSNFTNHLYTLTEQFCNNENISFQSLFPLIKETADRLSYYPPSQMQTGPAIRHDEPTLQRHLEALHSYPDLQNLYRLLTASIQTFSKQ